MNRLYKFEIDVDPDSDLARVEPHRSFPVFDYDSKRFVGGFTRSGWRCYAFVEGVGHPSAIMISSEEHFYFTPQQDHALVSEYRINDSSIRVTSAYEEEVDVERKK